MTHALGVLLLGEKRSGDLYTTEDLHLLRTFSTGFAVALEKAELFARVQQHSRELEQKVAERTQHLEELRENQKRMIGDISHALQTPLTVLKGTLNRIVASPENLPAYASIMEQSVTNVSTFVYDLLRLSRLDALPEPMYVRFDMSALVLRITEYVQTICDVDNITLVTHIEKGCTLTGNEKDIEELVTILLSNAVKYTKGSPLMCITVALQRTADEIVISIEDTGIGIPKDKHAHIFERFYRAHEAGKERGSGLGLAIAKRIVERHKGAIIVESIEGQGSTFTVRIPEDLEPHQVNH